MSAQSLLSVSAIIVACSGLNAANTRAADAAQAVIKASPDVIVHRGSYPGWPWIARTPSGTLVCVWREGTVHDFSADGRLQLSRSTDGGRTWSAATTFLDVPQVDDRNVAILCLSETEWLVCYNSYTHDRVSRVWTVRTLDGGETWGEPRAVCELDARTRAAPVRLSSGEIILPFYLAPGNQSLLGISSDAGQSWQVTRIENGPGFVGDEWDVVELPDGRLAGIIRNSAPSLSRENQGWFFLAESRDRGRNWSSARRTNLRDSRSTSPAQIFLHQGRPVVLYSNARMVSVVMATTDDPELLNWNVEQQLNCYVYRADRAPIQDGSYPVSVPVSERQRLVVDYVHDGESRTIAGYFVDLPAAWGQR